MVDWTGATAGDGCGLWDGEWLCVYVQLDGLLRGSVGSYVVGQYGR